MKTLFTALSLFCFWNSAQSQQITKMEFELHYNYTEENPTYTYRLNGKNLYRSINAYAKGENKLETQQDSTELNAAESLYLQTFLMDKCNEDKHYPLCRALSPVSARLELTKKDGSHVYMLYAPCRSSVLVEPFESLQEMLDKMFEE